MASAAKHNIALWTQAKTSQECGRSRKTVYHRCRLEGTPATAPRTTQGKEAKWPDSGKTHQAYAACLGSPNSCKKTVQQAWGDPETPETRLEAGPDILMI